MRAHHDANDPMLHTGMLKGFMDGSLGSRTAAMKAPFADDPGNTGLPQYTQAELNQMAVERAQAGFQLGFHAIGDKAAAMALDAFSQPGVSRTARNRIEHAQVVDPADIPRFNKLGVIASMQPNHLLTDMNWAEDRLGPKRAAYSYAWKAFLDAGVPLAFGTDYPVEPITPFRGLYAAVTRMNEAGTKTYFPENKLTRGQALYAYTQGSAYAEFAEKHKGKAYRPATTPTSSSSTAISIRSARRRSCTQPSAKPGSTASGPSRKGRARAPSNERNREAPGGTKKSGSHSGEPFFEASQGERGNYVAWWEGELPGGTPMDGN